MSKLPPSSRLETRFDAPFTATMALREKQVQQSYRPIIGIHKWFARRPGSLFRSLLLSEFGGRAVAEDYWDGHRIGGVIADPFMGGGTTVFEALRLGLSVVGSDVNPMSYWLVRQAVEPLEIEEFRETGMRVWERLNADLGSLYQTHCTRCDSDHAEAKYFLWVKVRECPRCSAIVPLYPGQLIAEAVRHPRNVYSCPTCNRLEEVEKGELPICSACNRDLSSGNCRRGSVTCLECGHEFAFANLLTAPPEHRLVAIEYNCSQCYGSHPGRQFKTPDAGDLARVAEASERLAGVRDSLLIPDEDIPPGDETGRLHRWGYRKYSEMFNDRQLLALGTLLDHIKAVESDRVRHALATVFSDFLRYQNLLCRYDTYALKGQDIFSVHGFPVGLIACEANVAGIQKVGSGGFVHFIEKFAKAKSYAKAPYETRRKGATKQQVFPEGESVEADLLVAEPTSERPGAWLACEPSQTLDLAPQSLDGVFTDPPYFDMVQYAELMDFCFVWLRKLLGGEVAEFSRATTRTEHELTGNVTLGRGLTGFTAGISEVFQTMGRAMKPGAPLVFTYHHNDPSAYVPLVVSILDAGLTCTAVLPAPGEMSASLHIAGTSSSVLDSVFVCRERGSTIHADGSIAELLERDREAMAESGYACTVGDLLCLRAGHMAAAAVRELVGSWNRSAPIAERVRSVERVMVDMHTVEKVA